MHCSPRHIGRIVKKLKDKDLVICVRDAFGKKASDPKTKYTINRDRINFLCPEFLSNLTNTFDEEKLEAHYKKRGLLP